MDHLVNLFAGSCGPAQVCSATSSVLWVVITSTEVYPHVPGLDFCMALQRRVSAVRNLCSAWHGHQNQPEFPKPLKLLISSAHALKPPQISQTAPKTTKKQGPSANGDLMFAWSNLNPINTSQYHCIQWLYPVEWCSIQPDPFPTNLADAWLHLEYNGPATRFNAGWHWGCQIWDLMTRTKNLRMEIYFPKSPHAVSRIGVPPSHPVE